MSEPVVGADYVTCQLVAATNASATTLLVDTPTNDFPTLGVSEYCYLTIIDQPSYVIDANPPDQREIVKVTAIAAVSTGFSLTVVRGVGDTTAQIWALGSICEIRPCEIWFQDLKGGDGGAWSITDGSTTVTDVTSLFSSGGIVTDLGSNAAAITVAPPGASYLTLGTNTVLTNERVLTAGTNVTFTDAGAGSTLTINASGSGGGSTSQSQAFTTSGTFTPGTGVTGVWVTMIGGGGGGASNASGLGGGGGGSGEYCVSFPVLVSGAVTVTIGAAGAAGSASAGGNGGDTSFDTLVARGGKGGAATLAASGAGGGVNGSTARAQEAPGVLGTIESPVFFGGSSGGGGGGIAPGAGGAGGANASFPTGAAGGAIAAGQGGGGGGANSPYGLGGAGGSNSNGTNASNTSYGAGGGGASGKASTNYTGGTGCAGYCLVTWVGP